MLIVGVFVRIPHAKYVRSLVNIQSSARIYFEAVHATLYKKSFLRLLSRVGAGYLIDPQTYFLYPPIFKSIDKQSVKVLLSRYCLDADMICSWEFVSFLLSDTDFIYNFTRKVIDFQRFELYGYQDDLSQIIFDERGRDPEFIIPPYMPFSIDFIDAPLKINENLVEIAEKIILKEGLGLDIINVVAFLDKEILYDADNIKRILDSIAQFPSEYVGVLLIDMNKLELDSQILKCLLDFVEGIKEETGKEVLSLYASPLDKLLGFDHLVLSPEGGYGRFIESSGGRFMLRIYSSLLKRELSPRVYKKYQDVLLSFEESQGSALKNVLNVYEEYSTLDVNQRAKLSEIVYTNNLKGKILDAEKDLQEMRQEIIRAIRILQETGIPRSYGRHLENYLNIL